MNDKEFASSVAELIPNVPVQATRENARRLAEVWVTLDGLADGSLQIVNTGLDVQESSQSPEESS